MKSTVLCYNLKGTKKGQKITMIFGYLGYKVRHVEKPQYSQKIGALAGIMEEEEALPVYEGEGFEEEMLVMNPASEAMLDKALFLMRKEKLRVNLKAMVTEHNMTWTSLVLYEEIKKEHEYMNAGKEERKQ